MRILTLSTGSNIVCDGMIKGSHGGKSLAGELDSQLFSSRRALVHKTQICLGQCVGFGYVFFQKETHRRAVQEREKWGLGNYSILINFRTYCWGRLQRPWCQFGHSALP